MDLSTRSRRVGFACGVSLAGTALGSTPPDGPRPVATMLSYWTGKNLTLLPDREKADFEHFLKKHLLSRSDLRNPFNSPENLFLNDGRAYVWRFGSSDKNSFLIFLNPHSGVIPSAEHAWLFFVNEKGRILSRSDFDTGWRMYASGARFERVSWLSSRVLVQEMSDGVNGQGPRKIFIGFDGFRPYVVRIEGDKGAIRKMDYFAPNWVVGPPFLLPSKTEVLRILAGSNEVLRLATLIWLAGNHGGVRWTEPNSKPVKSQIRHSELLRDAEIGNGIKVLRRSANPYIKELAMAIQLHPHR